jgi:hypothetical protein
MDAQVNPCQSSEGNAAISGRLLTDEEFSRFKNFGTICWIYRIQSLFSQGALDQGCMAELQKCFS